MQFFRAGRSVQDLGFPHRVLAGVPQTVGRQTRQGSLREVRFPRGLG
jgi:hypothetical protein